ncbi:MAG: response regulator [Bacteriovorax sp.]|nr:response regulator [Bacteriovorax sp.]
MKKILLIDDDSSLLELISEELKNLGFWVVVAICGNEAIEILKDEAFDLVISDFRMPNGNGMVVLEHVNKMIRPPTFFFLSAQADMSIEDCLKAGAKKFINKPVDLNKIVYEIENIEG